MHKHTVQVRLDTRDEDEAELIKYLQSHSIFGRKSIAIRAMLLHGYRAIKSGEGLGLPRASAPRLIDPEIGAGLGQDQMTQPQVSEPPALHRIERSESGVNLSQKNLESSTDFNATEPSQGLSDFIFGQDD